MSISEFFRVFKKNREKKRAREAAIAALPSRSLDGTYKLVMVYYSPDDSFFTPKELNMERSELIISGNHFDIYSRSGYETRMHEAGTFSVEKNGSREKIAFYVDGDVLFATGDLVKWLDYTDIRQLTIVDKRYRLSQFGFTYQQKY
ncbi:MAG: hypothetical protein IKE93_09970 [Erysipelotrichaceae bacterium]|nr:hypothetical protein [Erysipelotrichaceae bacterium]